MDRLVSQGVVQYPTPPGNVIDEILNRDAALWVGEGVGLTEEQAAMVAKLMALPWRLVLCEENSEILVSQLTQFGRQKDVLASHRGFIKVISRDPRSIICPARALPIYLLNGREGADDLSDSNRLSATATQRRRLNMIERLLDEKPRMLVVVSCGEHSVLPAVRDVWEEGFRSQLVYITESKKEVDDLKSWCSQSSGPPLVQVISEPCSEFINYCVEKTKALLKPDRYVLRYRVAEDSYAELDVTSCENVEYPILDRYHLLLARDLTPIQAEDLSDDALNSFFQKSSESWKPYAAGVPWARGEEDAAKVLRGLEEVAAGGYEQNRLYFIASEPGAGGTTLAHDIAWKVAKKGFPTLVAKQISFVPDVTELTSFLFRVRQLFIEKNHLSSASGSEDSGELPPETPALLVFDVPHWKGREQQLRTFMWRLRQDSRPAVVLVVVEAGTVEELSEGTIVSDAPTHSLTEEDALNLGRHLNLFLKPKRRDRSPEEWLAFWRTYSPQIGDIAGNVGSFWVSLQFWLRRQLDLTDSIQRWLYDQFSQADLSNELRAIILTIAELSLHRQSYPEGLFPVSPEGAFPHSVLLEDARREIPALGLIRVRAQAGPQWLISHVLLARYLLTAAFRDRKFLKDLGFGDCTSIVNFRLELLHQLATREDLGTTKHLPLAQEFAVNILKLDREGNREFFAEWRRVLEILEEMPDSIWDISRTFNHHVAISRRRVAVDHQMFVPSADEQRTNLELAIEHLEYALTIDRDKLDTEDEKDLNILNSLARAYQDLANVEIETGADLAKVKSLRDKATTYVRKAAQEDPNSPYVLETLAHDLVQRSKLFLGDSSRNVCEALGLIQRALALESAVYRRDHLLTLMRDCLEILKWDDLQEVSSRLRKKGDPFGFIAQAWLILQGEDDIELTDDFNLIPPNRCEEALGVLERVPSSSRCMYDLMLKYSLLASLRPLEFSEQLEVLDELQSTGAVANLQMSVEYAILLYQNGRSQEGSGLFREIRRSIAKTDVFVTVPHRMRVLLEPVSKKPLVCQAVAVEERGFRSRACVQEFARDRIPFIPRDFGKKSIPVGEQFSCNITFGPNGPFIKPTT